MHNLPSFISRTRRLRDESGQALIEFAFVLVMMVVLILGLVDFARVFLQYQVITDAGREGARRAVVADENWTPDAIYNGILSSLGLGGINTDGAVRVGPNACDPPSSGATTVTVYECNWTSTMTGEPVRVGIAVPFDFALVGPFIGWATGDRKITLRTTFFMRNE